MKRKRRLVVGDRVTVSFGVNRVPATVSEVRGDRVFVRFAFDGADESVRLGYRQGDLTPLSPLVA